MKNRIRYCCVLAASLFVFSACNEKFPLENLDEARTSYVSSDTSYVEIVPPFVGFSEPRALLIGNDFLLYVADTKNNRVVMMNLAGTELSSRTILQPMSLAQDMRLDLLIGGLVVEPNGDTVCAVFRMKLVQANHSMPDAILDTVHKEYITKRRYVGIGAMPDNKYLVARSGPDISRFNDPDTRVMFFDANDNYITPVLDLATRAGTGITDINQVTSLRMFPNSKDFVILQTNAGSTYGAIWMTYELKADFDGWLPKFDPNKPDQQFADFIQGNRFIQPMGVAIDPKRKDIFITDMTQDSVFKFNSRGALKAESFGSFRTFGRMKKPSGAAFFNYTLFISDVHENKIFRYKLSTDF